jgi:hypothetical protein
MLFFLPSFTGGSSSRPKRDHLRKKAEYFGDALGIINFRFAEEGTFEEEFVS